jgi:hypothetical protein
LSALLWYIRNEATVKTSDTKANKPFIPFTSDYRKKGQNLQCVSRLWHAGKRLVAPIKNTRKFPNACLEMPL